nr:MAG TPA: intron associated endonuclease [Caudoviricetes sp.]
MDRKYKIYVITSEHGGKYIGLTKTSIQKRFSSHITRSKRFNGRHPLYDSIKSLGKEKHFIEIIIDGLTKEEAELMEIRTIEEYRQRGEKVLNVSKGGENDGLYGAEKFKRLMENPEFHETFCEKVKQGCEKRDHSYLNENLKKVEEWRISNPKEAYKKSMRALRIGGRYRPFLTDNKERLKITSKKIRSFKLSNSIKLYWKRLDQKEKGLIHEKISSTLIKRYENDKELKKNNEDQLKSARKNINREKQAKAAKEGLKKFWEDLKKDPERYEQYMMKRKRKK